MSGLDLKPFLDLLIEYEFALFGLFLLLFVLRSFVWGWWFFWFFVSFTSINGNQTLRVTDMESVRSRRAETVRSRWWHEPTVWTWGFALLCAHSALVIAARWIVGPPPPHPGLVEYGLAHLEPATSGDGMWMLAFYIALAISLCFDARTSPYTIDDEGIRRKRYFGGERLLRWQDVESVEVSGNRPIFVIFNGKTPEGKAVMTTCANGFYNRKAFEPVVYRLLGRRTVNEEEVPGVTDHADGSPVVARTPKQG